MLGGLRLVLPFQLVDAQHDIPRDLGERAIEVNALRRGGRCRRLTLEHRTDLRTMLAWQDIGEAEDTEKPMSFWLKPAR